MQNSPNSGDGAPKSTQDVLVDESVSQAVQNEQVEIMTEAAKKKNPAKKALRIILSLFLILTVWYVASDKLAPYASTGAVSAPIAQIAARVGGEVAKVDVVDNQIVVAGEPLFNLDQRPFDLAVTQAEIALANAVKSVNASRESLVGTEARVATAQTNLENARQNYERVLSLTDRQISSQSQLDAAQANLSTAENSLAAAQADLASATVNLGGDGNENTTIAAAQLQLDQAKLNRDYSAVVAPSNGVITNMKLTEGKYIGVGSPALTFIAVDARWINVDLRENQLTHLNPDDPVSIVFDAYPAKMFHGRVDSIAWGIDTGRTEANGLLQNQSSQRWFEPARTIPVKIIMDEDADWPENIRVGSKASVVVYTGGYNNPIAFIGLMLHHIKSYISYIY